MAEFRLSATAEADIIALLTWTETRFGDAARHRYQDLLVAGLNDIATDPERLGSLSRPELGVGVRSYHLFYSREKARSPAGIVRRPRHFLLYRPILSGVIGVGRVLHDAMDAERHVPLEC